MKPFSRLLSVLLSLALALFAVSAGIAAPILWRGFYTLQINALHLPGQTGWTEEVIREAYAEMMDFCVKGAPFGTGALKWSEEGMRHFEDVRMLFRLDLTVLILSTAALLILFFICRRVRPYRFFGRGPSFYAGAGILSVFAVVTVLAASNFDRAFVVFHRIFFPGKTNWIFDPATDEIIRILPQEFFRNCALLSVILIALFSAAYLYAGRKQSS